MSIAINEDHRLLADTASDLLAQREARGASRDLLESESETLPAFWQEAAELGWLGLHLPEEFGGAGFGLEETAVVAEQMGRSVAPGPFAPTVIASAVIDAIGDDAAKKRFLPGLADGSAPAGVALDAEVEVSGGTATGTAPAVLGGGLATLLVLPAGDDAVVVEVGDGVSAEVPANLDPSRRSARIALEAAPVTVLPGGRRALVDRARVVLSAEAAGVARQCTELAAGYAREREQFGRVIGTFQAVKHHCANMAVATELVTSAAWDAARAAQTGGDQLAFAAAAAAALAAPAADLCANLATQVHGGIAITWEHDAHLYMRRSTALLALLNADEAAAELTDLTRRGTTRARTVELPPEAEELRAEVRALAEEIAALPQDRQKERLIETGYAVPHWPEPYGRSAGAVEQLVVEQEFAEAGVERPSYGITGWVILTLVQHGTVQQVSRWVGPALRQDVIWCQLFSEPAAGSDAAGIKTRATRVEGGWRINGQKVWTSGAHKAGMGFATVRTDPDVPKHQGITMMVIDMHAEGVEVRPIKMPSGASEFNEVFFEDVFVPDEDVVGPINGGWTVARATLGNESVSIGGGQGSTMSTPASAMVPHLDAHPERLPGGAARIGRYAAEHHAMDMLNMRSAHRAVAGGEPGPEGAITKLVLSELGHEAAAILNALTGPDSVYLDGPGAFSGALALLHRGLSIAGGTSEIKRNQIGERILGLPRDPLIK
ncbi:acyl-CoA dehydrogenase [Saccharopolyspora rhizosphaerae]|uniref:Acyl-CoA dehydrogenase n=1 Tax=Saccharopolyspora rhizosphaerae TaxID=2492662 RepID=A0A3R8QAM3_9PSEU|nr:acyl-CoA dehydrogenase [Saccharopolyspora rhizosphaerae]RRO20669.1 acyl-CoA dehydrogenase [Saccharopolyspora rhizosphaerae]